MTATAWVGVDPGSRDTAIVTRVGAELVAFAIIERVMDEAPGHGVGAAYIEQVCEAVDDARLAAVFDPEGRRRRVRLGIEGLVPPTGFRGGKVQFANPRDLIAVALVVGGLLRENPDAILVRPDSHGRRALITYPQAIVTPGEAARGLRRAAPQNTRMRHARSAWDITLSAERLANLPAALAGAGR